MGNPGKSIKIYTSFVAVLHSYREVAEQGLFGRGLPDASFGLKGMTSDEVFDQLMLCMVKSIRKYDPFFHEKVKRVVDAIEGETLRDSKLFSTQSVNRVVGYECAGYLRYLAKRLFLVAVAPTVPGEPQYKRTAEWPPPRRSSKPGLWD
jgi:hypothetical protein